MALTGRVALVTGAARGIGQGIASVLLERGARVATLDVLDIDESTRHPNQLHIKADVSNREAVRMAFEHCAKEIGAPDILVPNAGGAWRRGPVVDIEEDEWNMAEYTANVLLWGNIVPCHFFAKEMKRRALAGEEPCIGSSHGKICLVSSIMSLFASSGRIEYSSVKAALNHVVPNLAHELGQYRVNVNAVLPGHIDTPGERAKATEEELQQTAKGIPWQRMGTPHDIAKAVAFLCSEDADYITGSTLVVDGGFMSNLVLPGWVNRQK